MWFRGNPKNPKNLKNPKNPKNPKNLKNLKNLKNQRKSVESVESAFYFVIKKSANQRQKKIVTCENQLHPKNLRSINSCASKKHSSKINPKNPKNQRISGKINHAKFVMLKASHSIEPSKLVRFKEAFD